MYNSYMQSRYYMISFPPISVAFIAQKWRDYLNNKLPTHYRQSIMLVVTISAKLAALGVVKVPAPSVFLC